MGEPVTVLRTPVRLQYTVTAGRAWSRFLRRLSEGRLSGERCPGCHKVYVPPPGACPTCGVPTGPDEVLLPDVGTLTTFSIIRIPFEGQVLTPPYCAGSILLDGADVPLFHLVGGVPVDDVRMGMRLRALWSDTPGPTFESVRWFEPTGEPDAPFSSYEAHL